MNRWKSWLARLGSGGVACGLINALGDVNFNQIWFQLITGLLAIFVTILLGGDVASLQGQFA